MKSLNDILTTKQIECIVRKVTGTGDGDGGGEEGYQHRHQHQLVSQELRPAAAGLVGFLGKHYRLTLRVRVRLARGGGDGDGDGEGEGEGEGAGERTLRLFVKTLPGAANRDKRTFVVSGNFFRREELMFQLFEDMGAGAGGDVSDPNPWHPKAFLCTDTCVLMPDLSFEGYSARPRGACLDLPHAAVAAAALARFHAAFANYDTAQTTNGNRFSFLQKHKDLFIEPSFSDSPWLREAAIVSSSLIETYSKHKDIPNLNENMTKLFIEACKTFQQNHETLNLVIHRDLWCGNILFRYEKNVPTNAILLDFQCLQYGPPAFDVAIFLYLQTSRKFREAHEKEVCMHYYNIFLENLDEATRKRLEKLGYSLGEFLSWFERAREYGMVVALSILPYVLMDALAARRVYDDPDTYARLLAQGRSRPVLEYCLQNAHFRERQVEIAEEFIRRYILKVT